LRSPQPGVRPALDHDQTPFTHFRRQAMRRPRDVGMANGDIFERNGADPSPPD